MAHTTKARYYIRVDTYWQNSPDYFVGPFDSRDAAQQAIEAIPENANVWLSINSCSGDLKAAVRLYPSILTATEAKRGGMIADLAHPKYNVISRVPMNSEDLFWMVESIRN